jgi:RNA polymerase sigma factor (sigma-70 family)
MENEVFRILMDDPDRGLRLIMELHGPQLLKQIGRIIQHDDELVKDVFQLTLIAIWTDHKKIGELEDPFAWIMAIARNTALSTLRSERIRLKEPIEHHEDLRSSEQADTELVYKETLDELLFHARRLTPREEEIYIASKVDGMDNKELEKVHNLKAQRVRNLLSSAQRKIRMLLRR